MADLLEVTSRPGVRRDGTELDSPFHADGVWVRWMRGKARKMGGYSAMSQLANGPVRAVFVDSRNGQNTAHVFSQWGVQRLAFDISGAGGALEDRTPIGFVPNDLYTWTHAAMYSSTGGAYAALLAASTPDLSDLTSDTPGSVWSGNMNNTDTLAQVSDGSGPIAISGGLCVLQPFLFVYGSNGLIRNSNANDFSSGSGWTTGGANFANSANPAGTKIVYGAPVRGGGQAPAGLFWALDALIRVTFVGGTTIWNYDTLSCPTNILSKKCVVEVDGKFFWVGTDRFLFYNGVVQELPNDMNTNYFFENLNWAQRNKVWGTKVQRYGEIWWFYPRGTDTECNDAIIFNYRENTWYDAHKARSAGDAGAIASKPIWAGSEDSQQTTNLPTGLRGVTNAVCSTGSATLRLTSRSGMTVGMYVSANVPGIPPGTTITGFTGVTDVTLSNAFTVDVAAGVRVHVSWMSAVFLIDSVITGATTGATGTVVRVNEIWVNVKNVSGTFSVGEAITASTGAAKVYAAPFAQELDTVYQQERGWDKVAGQEATALTSSYTTRNFGYAIGDPINDAPKTMNRLTRIIRFEPDFNQTGDMKLYVEGRSYANDDTAVLGEQDFTRTTSFVDPRLQARIMRLRFESATVGGFYEQGQLMAELEPGDERPTTNT